MRVCEYIAHYRLTLARIYRIFNPRVFSNTIKLELTDKFLPANFALTLAQIAVRCGSFGLQKSGQRLGEEKHADPISTKSGVPQLAYSQH